MTFIRPNKQRTTLDLVLGALVILILGGTFWLVVLYNHVVDANHAIAADKAMLDTIGAKNTQLSNQAMAAIGNAQAASLASQDGLVSENKPQYFQASAAPTTLAAK